MTRPLLNFYSLASAFGTQDRRGSLPKSLIRKDVLKELFPIFIWQFLTEACRQLVFLDDRIEVNEEKSSGVCVCYIQINCEKQKSQAGART